MRRKTQDPKQGDFHADFERLIQSFRAIATIPNPIERRFRLNRVAPYHGLPRAEFRKLFELWQLEQFQTQGGQR